MPYNRDGVGYKRDGTSADAADAVAPCASTIRARALAAFRQTSAGMTADEVAERIGLEFVSVRPRVTELHTAGWIKKTDERRIGRFGKTQAVWRLA